MDTEHPDPADLDILRSAFGTDGGLGWEAVHAFEAEHGIVLPEPYRTCVAEISDGCGFGPPDRGLLGLTEKPDGLGVDWDARDLAKPFPLTEMWVWEADDRGLSQQELNAVLDPVFKHGSVVLGTDGCGMDWYLVVTGEHRGHIWNISGEGAGPFGSEFGYTTGRSGFAGWVQHWADGEPTYDLA
jgi:hypothetical protein